MKKHISVTLKYGQKPWGKHPHAGTQQMQNAALDKFLGRAFPDDVNVTRGSDANDPHHVLHLTVHGDTPAEVRSTRNAIRPRPRSVSLRIREIAIQHNPEHVTDGDIADLLRQFQGIPHTVTPRALATV